MRIAQEKTTTRELKFLFLDRSRSRREGTATGGAVSYDHNSLYFIFGQTMDGKTRMSHVDVLCFNEITDPKTWPKLGLD